MTRRVHVLPADQLKAALTPPAEEVLVVPLEPGEAFFTPSRLHALRNATSRVRAVLTVLEKGYKFDDERAAKHLELLREAHATLEDAFDELAGLFASGDPQATRLGA